MFGMLFLNMVYYNLYRNLGTLKDLRERNLCLFYLLSQLVFQLFYYTNKVTGL